MSTVPVTMLYHFKEKAYNGIYYRDDNFKLARLGGAVTFIVRGNTIVGRDFGGVIVPILDEQGNMIVIESGLKKQITNQRQYGINEPYIPPLDSRVEQSPSPASDFWMEMSPTPERRLEWSPIPNHRMGFSPTPEHRHEWSPTPEFRLHRSRSPTKELRY